MAQILYKDVKLFDVLNQFGSGFINDIETVENLSACFEDHPVVVSEEKKQMQVSNIFCIIQASASPEINALQAKYAGLDTVIFEIIK